MNRDVLAPLIAGLALGLLMGKTPGVAASADPAKGKAVYEKHCLVCHGPQGKGDGPAGRMLKPPAADFTNAETKKKSKADLMQIVENGKPGTAMGPWKGQLSQAEVNDLMEYVLTLMN
jgi:mono/diheme cytochrome c family protein